MNVMAAAFGMVHCLQRMSSKMQWISVDEALPVTSECVLITDGKHVGGAHFFSKLYNPRTGEHSGPEWDNQFYRLTGGYIPEPTHWVKVESLLDLLLEHPHHSTNSILKP